MPITHEIVDGVLRVRRFGSIESQDETRACEERERDERIVPGIPVFVDCTGVDPADSVETVRHLADCVMNIAAELQCGPVAILVANDVQFGMARMYMSLTDPVHPWTEVFRDAAEAETWLSGQRTAPTT